MGFFKFPAMALASIFNLFMPISMAIPPACDLYQNMVMGQEYYIFNSEYPNYYGPSTSCRWVANSVPGTKIVVSCDDIDIPNTPGCNGDRLAISLSGNQKFADSKNYCGKGTVSLVSDSNQMAIGLFSTASTGGGRFSCMLTSILNSEPSDPVNPETCDCGWKQSNRIVGGQETGINEFPSMAALIDPQNKELFCGASIISKRYVLTAAHCLKNRKAPSFGILVGDHNISSGSDTAYAALYAVNALEIHPEYNSNSQANDVAIIQTKQTIVFSLYVGPICLPFKYTSNSFAGQLVTALGWGQTEFTGPKSDVLQKVVLTVTTNMNCQQLNPGNVITPRQLCTYGSQKDSCQGDSGGPLLWKDTSSQRMQLVGVISQGLGCATARPSISSRVTSYLTWIVSRTGDAGYCIK